MFRTSLIIVLGLASCSAKENISQLAAGSACTSADDCLGGTCLGVPGQPFAGNPRFAGGYCTHLGCTPDSQDGCGPDEWCIDGGDVGGLCAKQCSKADGLECERGDQVCLGLGYFGGCFSHAAVECNVRQRTGCDPADICVRIGFDDPTLGRCETACDPMRPKCPAGDGCYYIRTYNTAFCNTPGDDAEGDKCVCDKCCAPGLACTPDTPTERHCARVCAVADGSGCHAGEQCVQLKVGSPWGGCVAKN